MYDNSYSICDDHMTINSVLKNMIDVRDGVTTN